MKITEMLLTPNKYSRPQIALKSVKKIVLHYIGNPNTSAQANRNYFENQKTAADTFHRIILSVLAAKFCFAFPKMRLLIAQILRIHTA